MRRLVMLTILAGLLLSGVGTAAASCSPATNIETALHDSTTVFVAEVVTVADGNRIAEMRVLSVWKGADLPDQVEVWGTTEVGVAPQSDDGRFTIGRSSLVIPETSRQPFLATKCSATRPFTATNQVVPARYHDAVGATTGRAPLPTETDESATSSGPEGTVVLGVAIAGLSASAFGLMRGRRREMPDPLQLPGGTRRSKSPRNPLRRHRVFTVGIGGRIVTRPGMKQGARQRRP